MCAFPVVDLVSANSLNLKKYYHKPELQLYLKKKNQNKTSFLNKIVNKKDISDSGYNKMFTVI